MKLLTVTTFLFLCAFLIKPSIALAQQPKAYEKVVYKAKTGNKLFVLHYADGYLAATTLEISGAGPKKQWYIAKSGVADNKGNFVLQSKKGNTKANVVLCEIDDSTPAPQTIKAFYNIKNKRIALVFKQ